MKKIIIKGSLVSGLVVGGYAQLFRLIDLISYSEWKTATLLSIGLGCVAVVANKFSNK